MKMFDLYAELKLDSSSFSSGVSAAEVAFNGLKTNVANGVTSIQTSVSTATSDIASLDADIAALDEELAALELETANLELDLELSDLESEMEQLTKDIKSADFKTAFLDGFYSGLAEGATDLLKDLVHSGLEFVGDSIEEAAKSGTDAANAYNTAVAKFDIGTQALKSTIGNSLLPVITAVYDGLSSLLGISDLDLSVAMLDQIEAYTFENLFAAEASLANIFAMGESYEAKQAEIDFDSVIAGYESQAKYWEEYTSTLAELQERGFASDFLNQYTSGAQSDFEQLQWLASLTNDQIAQMQEAAEATERARINTAAQISSIQLANDEAYVGMASDYYALVDKMREEHDAGGGFRFDDTHVENSPYVKNRSHINVEDLYKMTDNEPLEIPISFVGSDGQEMDWDALKIELSKDDKETSSTLDRLDATISAMNTAIDNMNAAATALANRKLVAYVDARSLARDTAPYMNGLLTGDL